MIYEKSFYLTTTSLVTNQAFDLKVSCQSAFIKLFVNGRFHLTLLSQYSTYSLFINCFSKDDGFGSLSCSNSYDYSIDPKDLNLAIFGSPSLNSSLFPISTIIFGTYSFEEDLLALTRCWFYSPWTKGSTLLNKL